MDDTERRIMEAYIEWLPEWTKALNELNKAMATVIATVGIYGQTLNAPEVRRMIREQELGYKIPDWVWNVEETMRRTEGSGNGRVMRD